MQEVLVRNEKENAQYREQVERNRRRLVETKYQTALIDQFDTHATSQALLSIDQRTCISNLIHHFDHSVEQETNQMLALQKSIPLKLRLKFSTYESMVRIYYETSRTFFEQIPDYQELNIVHRTGLSGWNRTLLVAMGVFNSTNTTGFRGHKDKEFKQFHELFYGEEILARIDVLCSRLESIVNIDRTIIKLFMALLGFTHLIYDVSISMEGENSYSHLIHDRQQRFLVLFWSYLLYQFPEEHLAARLFSQLIFFSLDVQNFFEEVRVRQAASQNAIDEMIKKMESSITVLTID